MNLLNAPQDAVERLQSHPAARSLGPIQTWSEEQFYTVAAHAYDLPYRHITMADVDGDAFHRHQAFFIRNGQIPIRRLPEHDYGRQPGGQRPADLHRGLKRVGGAL